MLRKIGYWIVLVLAVVGLGFVFRASIQAQQQMGAMKTMQLNTTYYVGQVTGYYPSIQSAVTKACSTSGGKVAIPAGATPSDTIAGVTGGCTTVGIIDERVVPSVAYKWVTSAYVAQASGGGAPGGANTELQLNSSSAFGGAGLFQAIAGNPLYSAGTYFSGNPFVSSSYNGTSQIPPPAGGQVYGLMSNMTRCNTDAVIVAGGVLGTGPGTHDCMFTYDNYFAPGWNTGAGFGGNAGWAVGKTNQIMQTSYTPGIAQILSMGGQWNKTGDDADIYAYCFNKGGWIDNGGEGHTCIRTNGGQQLTVFAGASQQTGVALSSISLSNNSTGDGNPLVGGYLENVSGTALSSGQITAYTQFSNNVPGQFTTTDSHAISAAWGNTTTVINHAPNVPNGTSVAVTVHVAGGSNAAGFAMDAVSPQNTLIFFACDDFPDFVHPTSITALDGSGNQIITGLFSFSHNVGCPMFQGTIQGLLDLAADRQNYGGQPNYRTAYIIAGAIDPTHLSYRFYQAGGQGPLIPSQFHNFGSTQSVTLSRASGLVTANSVLFDFGGQILTVSGAADSSFNGTFTASAVNTTQKITWAQGGADVVSTTATISTGGAVGGMSGSGAYYVWPMARIQSVGTTKTITNGVTNLTYNGTLNLEPNNMPVTIGNQIIGPADPANKTSMLAAIGIFTTPPTSGLQSDFAVAMSGSGVANPEFRGMQMLNTNSYTLYKGGGGTGRLVGATGIAISGPFGTTYSADAPLPGGVHDFTNSNTVIGSGATYSGYYLRVAAQQSGNFGFTEFYDPVAHKMTISNSNNGVICQYSISSIEFNYNICPLKALTPIQTTNDTTVATTAYVKTAIAAATPSVAITGTPSIGWVPTATSSTAATWQAAYTGSGNPVIAPKVTTPLLNSGSSANTDIAGLLTLVGGTKTYTFTGTYTNAPICTASDTTAIAAVQASATTTVLTVNGTGTDTISYICVGRP